MIKTELYFGMAIGQTPARIVCKQRMGTAAKEHIATLPRQDVSDYEFLQFINEYIAPAFPDGFTITEAIGQYRHDDRTTIREKTMVVMILHTWTQSDQDSIEYIRNGYKRQFNQESVLRIDTELKSVQF